MKNDHHQKLHQLVSELMEENARTPSEQTYQSVMGVVFSILENGQLDDLDTALKRHFPQYYSTPIPLTLPEN